MFKIYKYGKTNINPLKGANILVFLFLGIIVILIFLIVYFSKININIKKVKISSSIKNYIEDYQIEVALIILSKFPIFKRNFSKQEKCKKHKKITKLVDKNIEKLRSGKNVKLDKEILIYIKNTIRTITKRLDIKMEIGTEDAALTAILIPIIYTLSYNILRVNILNYNSQNLNINPLFINKNLLNIVLIGIFEIKLSHIIHIVYMLNKKNKGVNKNERTSNRRAYGYSYE